MASHVFCFHFSFLFTRLSELLLDDHGRLSEMKQSNFTIRVLRYNKKDGLFLPKKIFIKGKDIQLKLVINEWGIY